MEFHQLKGGKPLMDRFVGEDENITFRHVKFEMSVRHQVDMPSRELHI